MYQEIDDCIFLREPEGTVSFCRDDLYRYSGPRSMIASALVFRIMKEAIHDLSPSDIPERKAFMILSGHAGPGVETDLNCSPGLLQKVDIVLTLSEPRKRLRVRLPAAICFSESATKIKLCFTFCLMNSSEKSGFDRFKCIKRAPYLRRLTHSTLFTKMTSAEKFCIYRQFFLFAVLVRPTN